MCEFLCKTKLPPTLNFDVTESCRTSNPQMNAASLDKDCFPEPPTPMSIAFPLGRWMMRQIRVTCSCDGKSPKECITTMGRYISLRSMMDRPQCRVGVRLPIMSGAPFDWENKGRLLGDTINGLGGQSTYEKQRAGLRKNDSGIVVPWLDRTKRGPSWGCSRYTPGAWRPELFLKSAHPGQRCTRYWCLVRKRW